MNEAIDRQYMKSALRQSNLKAGRITLKNAGASLHVLSTASDLSVDDIVRAALKQSLETVLVVGYQEDGELYISGSSENIADNYFMLDQAKDYFMGLTQYDSEYEE